MYAHLRPATAIRPSGLERRLKRVQRRDAAHDPLARASSAPHHRLAEAQRVSKLRPLAQSVRRLLRVSDLLGAEVVLVIRLFLRLLSHAQQPLADGLRLPLQLLVAGARASRGRPLFFEPQRELLLFRERLSPIT